LRANDNSPDFGLKCGDSFAAFVTLFAGKVQHAAGQDILNAV
jgi:hypothetical protein